MTGLIYAFTGEGKGKTSAALGVAVRVALSGKKVVIIQWYKEKRWPIAEHKLGEVFKNIEILPMGNGFYKLPSDHATPQEHQASAKVGLQQATNSLREKPFLLVLDEVLNAISDGLITEEEVLKLLEQRGKTHLVLTGRSSHLTRTVLVRCDLVTECKKIKHPFDLGKLAVAGLDY